MNYILLKRFLKPVLLMLLSISMMINSTLAVAGVTISDAYIREMPPGQTASAAFMQLTNNTDEIIVLTGGRSDKASAIEIHQHQAIDGVMRMSRLAQLVIKPNETIILKPGRLHLMIMGLEQRLMKGTHFSFELQFADGQRQTLSLPIRSLINP